MAWQLRDRRQRSLVSRVKELRERRRGSGGEAAMMTDWKDV